MIRESIVKIINYGDIMMNKKFALASALFLSLYNNSVHSSEKLGEDDLKKMFRNIHFGSATENDIQQQVSRLFVVEGFSKRQQNKTLPNALNIFKDAYFDIPGKSITGWRLYAINDQSSVKFNLFPCQQEIGFGSLKIKQMISWKNNYMRPTFKFTDVLGIAEGKENFLLDNKNQKWNITFFSPSDKNDDVWKYFALNSTKEPYLPGSGKVTFTDLDAVYPGNQYSNPGGQNCTDKKPYRYGELGILVISGNSFRQLITIGIKHFPDAKKLRKYTLPIHSENLLNFFEDKRFTDLYIE